MTDVHVLDILLCGDPVGTLTRVGDDGALFASRYHNSGTRASDSFMLSSTGQHNAGLTDCYLA